MLNESVIRKDIEKSLMNDNIDESNVNRLKSWFENYECAIISAYRNRIINGTENIWIQKDENGNSVGDDKDLTYAQNQVRHKKLKDALLGMKYGITSQRGRFNEKDEETGKEIEKTGEKSFVVVNLRNDPKFKENLFKLSEYFDQDSFIYKPKGTEEAVFVGTNNRVRKPFAPGYGHEERCGKFQDNVDAGCEYYSKIRGNKYVFEENKNDCLTRKFALCEESFDSDSYQGKQFISKCYKEFLNDKTATKLFGNKIK